MRTLSDLAVKAQNAETSDEVWLIRLTIEHASMNPNPLRFVNDRNNLRVAPANIIALPNFANWTLDSGAIRTMLGGTLAKLEDVEAGLSANLIGATTGLVNGTSYTEFVRFRKMPSPGTTAALTSGSTGTGGGGSSNLQFNTFTGAIISNTTSGSGNITAGVLDDGDSWLAYITRNAGTGRSAQVFAAVGATPTGYVFMDRPTLYAGLIGALTEWIAFPFNLDLPGEDTDSPSVARLRIDNVDRQIVEAVRGLPSGPMADLEVVLASQPETVEIGFYDLTIRAANYDAFIVEANMTFEQIFTEPVSFEMTPARFPGLF